MPGSRLVGSIWVGVLAGAMGCQKGGAGSLLVGQAATSGVSLGTWGVFGVTDAHGMSHYPPEP
jgi:hypothetical protein